MTAMRVVINGKFLRAPPTGVHRVAAELAEALAALKRESHPAVARLDFELLLPFDGVARAAPMRIAKRTLGPLTGIPWEQLTLPLRKGRGLLLNLCNIGPPLTRDAVTMIHDVQVHLSPASYSRGFRSWYRLVQPAFARRHRLILTVSEFSRSEIARVGLAPLERIAVVHNGVDHLAAVVPDDAGAAAIAGGASFVLGFATVQAHKNVAVLLRAFASPELATKRLVLVGGDDAAAFAAAGSVVPPNAIFAGRVSDSVLKALMQRASALAFPSRTEGFGLPPLEAMAVGCPAIVAPNGALPEICGDAAIYADADEEVGWVTAVRRLDEDDAFRESQIEKGRARAALFTWRAAAIKLATLLGELDRRDS